MKFALKTLKTMSQDEIIRRFSTIPERHTQIEITGIFYKAFFFESHPAAKALYYLPRHVTTVKFSGTYYLESFTVEVRPAEYNFKGNVLLQSAQNETRYNRCLGGHLVDFVSSLPKSVHHLILAFDANPKDLNTNISGGKITTSFRKVLEKIPPNITELDL